MSHPSRLETNWQTAKETLESAAHAAGIDSGIMVRIAGFESGFDSTARPIARAQQSNRVRQFDGVMAISSAYGYGQFVDGTWLAMLRKYGNKYGIEHASNLTKEQANDPKLRRDTQLQAAMLAEFTRENLERGALLGGPDASANVYAFHNLGQRDAARFLEGLAQSPDLRVDAVLPAAVVRGNPGLYGDGSQSISQAYAAMGMQMARFDRYAQGLESAAKNESINQGAPREFPERRLATGDNGPDVMRVQAQLNALGYKDASGHRLQNDGDFGHRTEYAVKAFQRAHGLPPVGHVGPKTRAALEAARIHGPSPKDPAHPDHALQRQVSHAVDAMERALGRHPDENSERLKASLLLAAKQQGLTRVDHVVLSEARGSVLAGQHVFAVQGRLDDPASRRVHVATQQALATPVQASWARLAQVEAMERVQPWHTHAHVAARHGEHGDGMRRMPAP